MSRDNSGQSKFTFPNFPTAPTQNAHYYPPPPPQQPPSEQDDDQEQYEESDDEDVQPQQQKLENPIPFTFNGTVENPEAAYINHNYPGEDGKEALKRALSTQDGMGQFNGGSYRISHRDSQTLLTLQLAIGCPLIAKHGCMIAMSPTVRLQGKLDISLKTIILRSQMVLSTYTGPGEVLLAPQMLGDITSLRLSGDETWSVAKDAYLACTQGVVRDFKRQGIGKAFFSGDGLFVFKVSGTGVMWITSFGVLVRKDLAEGEKYLVDNGHLVAWNTKYILQRAASRGYISGLSAGEGLVCKFTGPGTVFFQTRNPAGFYHWLSHIKEKFNPNVFVGGGK